MERNDEVVDTLPDSADAQAQEHERQGAMQLAESRRASNDLDKGNENMI